MRKTYRINNNRYAHDFIRIEFIIIECDAALTANARSCVFAKSARRAGLEKRLRTKVSDNAITGFNSRGGGQGGERYERQSTENRLF